MAHDTIQTRPAWQQGVIEDREQLDEMIKKLGEFLGTDAFVNLDANNRHWLDAQHVTMAEYSRILGERIRLFDQP